MIKTTDPCERCPLLKGKPLDADYKAPCLDKDGLFLGILMVSPMACEAVLKQRTKQRQGD